MLQVWLKLKDAKPAIVTTQTITDCKSIAPSIFSYTFEELRLYKPSRILKNELIPALRIPEKAAVYGATLVINMSYP